MSDQPMVTGRDSSQYRAYVVDLNLTTSNIFDYLLGGLSNKPT